MTATALSRHGGARNAHGSRGLWAQDPPNASRGATFAVFRQPERFVRVTCGDTKFRLEMG